MRRFGWLGLAVFAVACGGRSYLFDPTAVGDAGANGDDATGSSSGVGSSSGGFGSSSGTSSSGIGSSTGSGSSGGSTSGSSGGTTSSSGSGSSSGSSSGGFIDAGSPSCSNPASFVPSSEVPPYVNVMQMKGACTASEIAGFIADCDSASATNGSCIMWYQAASPTCLSCLGTTDAGTTRAGALDSDYQGNSLGANYAGCVAIVDGNPKCASAYESAVQCLAAAGCLTCTTQAQSDMCQQTIFTNGGACSGYIGPYESACMADVADGGAFNGGPCGDDTAVLSVICGNGSGDGG